MDYQTAEAIIYFAAVFLAGFLSGAFAFCYLASRWLGEVIGDE